MGRRVSFGDVVSNAHHDDLGLLLGREFLVVGACLARVAGVARGHERELDRVAIGLAPQRLLELFDRLGMLAHRLALGTGLAECIGVTCAAAAGGRATGRAVRIFAVAAAELREALVVACVAQRAGAVGRCHDHVTLERADRVDDLAALRRCLADQLVDLGALLVALEGLRTAAVVLDGPGLEHVVLGLVVLLRGGVVLDRVEQLLRLHEIALLDRVLHLALGHVGDGLVVRAPQERLGELLVERLELLGTEPEIFPLAVGDQLQALAGDLLDLGAAVGVDGGLAGVCRRLDHHVRTDLEACRPIRSYRPIRSDRGDGRAITAVVDHRVAAAGGLGVAAAQREHRADRAEHDEREHQRDDQALLAARDGDVGNDGVAREHEVLARLDEAQADVAEIDRVAAAQLDLAVVLAVDAHAVRRLEVADRVALRLGIARDLGVVAADRSMVDDDVVLVRATDDHLRAREIELLAGEVRRDADQLSVARRRRERGNLRRAGDRATRRIGIGHADRAGQAFGLSEHPGSNGCSNNPQLRRRVN